MEKGNIGTWSVKVGDAIAPGDVLCSIETDKATVDYEMQDEGFVAKILYPEGAKDIELGKVLAIIVEDKDDIAAFADYVDSGAPAAAAAAPATPAPAAPTPAAAPVATPAASSAPASSSGGRQFASPLARILAEENRVDLAGVSGTGPSGRIIKADIEDHLASGASQPAAVQAATPVFDSPAGLGFTDI